VGESCILGADFLMGERTYMAKGLSIAPHKQFLARLFDQYEDHEDNLKMVIVMIIIIIMMMNSSSNKLKHSSKNTSYNNNNTT
jgi:hypothetical protein